jgi:hypothetical protein
MSALIVTVSDSAAEQQIARHKPGMSSIDFRPVTLRLVIQILQYSQFLSAADGEVGVPREFPDSFVTQ